MKPRIIIHTGWWAKVQGLRNGETGICDNPRGTIDNGEDFWRGIQLVLPGQGVKELLFKNSSATQYPTNAKYVTTNNYVAECISVDGKNNGFLVTAPNGTQLTFDKLDIQHGTLPFNVYPKNMLGRVSLYASHIEDIHGNEIRYSYDVFNSGFEGDEVISDTMRQMLRKIESGTVNQSNHRLVTFEYFLPPNAKDNQKLLKYIHHDGRKWTFNYNESTYALEKVELPEGLSWKYENQGPILGVIDTSFYNGGVTSFQKLNHLSKVTTPTEAEIDYKYKSYPANFWGVGTSTYPVRMLEQRDLFDGENTRITTFSLANTSNNTISKATISSGNQTNILEYNRNTSDWKYGLLLSHEIKEGNVSIADQTYSYHAMPIVGDHNVESKYRPANLSRFARPQSKVTTSVEGKSNSITYSSFSTFGNPQKIVESGIAVESRATDLTYFTNTDNWVIELPKDVDIEDVDAISRTYSPDGTLSSINEYGVYKMFEYHSTGELHKVRWHPLIGGGWQEEVFTDYKRGIAQTVAYPENITIKRSVNEDGTLAWLESGEGHRTTYSYDHLSRLKKVEYPRTSTSDRNIKWLNPQQQEITQGTYKKITTYDRMGRVTETFEQDSSDNSTKRFGRSEYYANGQLKFQSLASSAYEDKGFYYEYDLLNRITLSKQIINDDSDDPETTYCYSGCDETTNLGVVVTDPDGYHSIYEYSSLGSPFNKSLIQVKKLEKLASENGGVDKYITLDITRNAIGDVTSVSTDNVTRTYQYHPTLTRLVEYSFQPELISSSNLTGKTQHFFDVVGNSIGRQVFGQGKIDVVRDGLNRVIKTTFPNGSNTKNINYGYDDDGNLEWSDNSDARWDYKYNDDGRLTEEKLTVKNKSYYLNYGYDDLNSLSSITYPEGWKGSRRIVELSPNALGQATQIGSYLSSISYHPSGGVSGATLANGQVLSVTQNERGLPESIQYLGSTDYSQVDYSYDYRGNITSIQESVNSSQNNRVLSYDGVNRLTSASGVWGNGSFSYDDNGNIKTKTIAGMTDTFHYNNNNVLVSVSGGQAKSFNYDGRGNITSDGQKTFEFDYANMTKVGDVSFVYDSKNHRVLTDKNGLEETISVYTSSGLLMHETDLKSGKTSDYLYLQSKLSVRLDECSDNHNVKNGVPTCDDRPYHYAWLIPIINLILF